MEILISADLQSTFISGLSDCQNKQYRRPFDLPAILSVFSVLSCFEGIPDVLQDNVQKL